jgi:hypothetical protein
VSGNPHAVRLATSPDSMRRLAGSVATLASNRDRRAPSIAAGASRSAAVEHLVDRMVLR